jgi:hypothetical protein
MDENELEPATDSGGLRDGILREIVCAIPSLYGSKDHSRAGFFKTLDRVCGKAP